MAIDERKVSGNLNTQNITAMSDYLIILFTSLTALGFEIVITRYFSIIFSYHYIFLSISVALLGYGLGGIIVSRLNLQTKNIGLLVIIYGISYLLPIFLPTLLPFFLNHPMLLSVVFLCPFLFGGIIISIYYRTLSSKPGLVYFFDLSGAGLGVLVSILLLKFTNPINIIILFVLIVSALSMIIKRNLFGVVGFITTILFLGVNIICKVIDIPFTKIPANAATKVMVQLLLKNPEAKIERTYWSYNFRTDVISYLNNPQTKCIFVDGGAPTIMFNTQKNFTNLTWLKNTINFLPLLFVSNGDFLSIGPGGGLDIILASLAEFKKIEAIEINPNIPKILDDYKHYNGDILTNSRLSLRICEGRNYLLRNKNHYDLIFLSLSLTNTAATTGIPYAESYLHTIEAYIDYYQHLKETGMVALFCETYPFLLRSILTMTIALNKMGLDIKETYKHIVVISNFLPESPYRYLVMLSRNEIPLSYAQIIQQEATRRNLNIEFLPYLNEKMSVKFDNLQAVYGYINQIKKIANIDIRPVVDEKPFFYDFSVKPHLPYILLCIFTIILALLFGFLKKKNGYLLAANFYLLGAGFMLVEVTVIQKFIFFLGSQTHAFCIILLSFLVSCSLGGVIHHPSEKNRCIYNFTGVFNFIIPVY